MITTLLTYALIALTIGLICGLLPIYTSFVGSQNRLKMFTGIASGIIIASAMLVVIPEGFELAGGEHHDENVAGEVAVVVLQVNQGTINASAGIEQIELIILEEGHHEDEVADDGHDHDHADESAHVGDIKEDIEHVISEVEAGDITPEEGIDEISVLIAAEQESHAEHEHELEPLMLGLAIMLGFVLMLVLEGSGIGHAVHEEHHDHNQEHGHDHVHHNSIGWLLVIGLTLHAAVDGLAIGAAAASGKISVSIAILIAVLIHKGPAALSLGIFSLHERNTKKESMIDVMIFSLATPVMMFVAYFVLDDLENSFIGLAMLFSAGTFLYVATVDTLPDIHNAETGKKAMIYVVIGVLVLTALLFLADATGLIAHAH